MKWIGIFLTACLLSVSSFAQVGIGTSTPNGKAVLDLSGTDKGLLVPRMTAVQRLAINPAMPARGLMVFDTDSVAFMFWTGSAWQRLGSGGSGGNFWALGGNALAGTERFGSTNNKPVVLIGTGVHMMRFDTGRIGEVPLPRITGGSELNLISGGAANTILNGGQGEAQKNKIVSGNWNTIGNGSTNSIIRANYSTILSGYENAIGFQESSAINYLGLIGGGTYNYLKSNFGFIGMGYDNYVEDEFGFIGNGERNRIYTGADYSFIGSGDSLVAAGGFRSFMGGGKGNSIAGVENNVLAGGLRNRITAGSANFLGAGEYNLVAGMKSVITGGTRDTVLADNSGILAGSTNSIKGGSTGSFIGSGVGNQIFNTPNSGIGSGSANKITDGLGGFIGGGYSNKISKGLSAITGGIINEITGMYGIIGGGQNNLIEGTYSAIGGGIGNKIFSGSDSSFIGGGGSNRIEMAISYGTIGGGVNNRLITTATGSIIGGGRDNRIEKLNSVIAGGINNWSRGEQSAILGGNSNEAGGNYSVVLGGSGNVAGGLYGISGGRSCENQHSGVIMFTDNRVERFESKATNQFLVRAGNGALFTDEDTSTVVRAQLHARSQGSTPQLMADQVGDDFARIRLRSFNALTNHWDISAKASAGEFNIFRNGTGNILKLIPTDATNLMIMSNGARLTTGGTWTNTSDRNVKDNISPVDGDEILEKLAAMPVATWHYKSEADSVLHIGPMAQDFKAAFGLGDSDKSIATIDADGVNMAAIKAIYQQVQQLTQRVQELEAKLKEQQTKNPAKP